MTSWDLRDGERRFEPIRVPFATARLAISRDGSSVAMSAVQSGALRVYDGASGELRGDVDALSRPEDFEGSASTAPVAFLPDNNLLVGSMAGPLRVIAPDGSELARIESPPLTTNHGMWLTAGGTQAVTLGIDNEGVSASTFNLEAGRRLEPDPTPVYRNCNQYAYAERIGAILCATWEGRVFAFDVMTGAEMALELDPQQGSVCGLAVADEGTRLIELTSCQEGGAAFAEWRLDGGGPVSRLVVDTPFHSFPQYGFAGDQTALVVEFATEADENPVTHVVDPATGDVRERYPGVYGLVPTDDPDVVIVIFDEDGTIGRFDLARREAVGPRIDPGFEILSLWTIGSRVIVKGPGGGEHGGLQGYDLQTGAPIGPVVDAVPGRDIIDVVIVGDVMYTIEVDDRWHVARRDATTGDVISDSANVYRNVASNGEITIASTISGRIFQADPVTLEPVGLPFPGTTGPASDLDLTSDGTMLMVRGDDETLRFYDVATRTPLGDPIDLNRFFMESGAVLRADGLQAAAVTGQGIVVWDLDPERWVEAACDVAGRNLTQAEWDQYIGDLAPYRRTCPEVS